MVCKGFLTAKQLVQTTNTALPAQMEPGDDSDLIIALVPGRLPLNRWCAPEQDGKPCREKGNTSSSTAGIPF